MKPAPQAHASYRITMARRFACRLFVAVLLCFPAYGANPAFDEAVTKAARISGLWEATLDQAQSLVFPSELPPVTRLYLNIHMRIRRDGDAVETTIPEARLDLEEKWVNTASPMYLYDRILLRNDRPIVGDGLEFSGPRCCEDSTEIRVRVIPDRDTPGVTVLISWAGKSAYIEFARPASTSNGSTVQGDWITSGSVLHVYVMEPYRVAATLDRLSQPDQLDLGYPFSDSGGDINHGILMMNLDTANTFDSFEGRLDSSDQLRVQWRGSGFLSGPDFHRAASGSEAQPVVPKP